MKPMYLKFLKFSAPAGIAAVLALTHPAVAIRGAQAPGPISLPPIDTVKFAGLTGERAVKEMTLPEGFKAYLFASEPDIRQPIAFCLDDRGRLWVAEGFQYPRRAPEGKGRDRILIFEDVNGDHHWDKRTVFMEHLNLVSGIEVGFGGVWVGAAPYLMFIADRDHNDVPDGKPEILLDGWDFRRDTHEVLNTFTWGPDGWLYGCHGVFCPSHVGKPGTPFEKRQRVDAAVWRYHPTQHRFEVFAEGTSNPWGVDFDERGQCFIEACVIPHAWHIIQGARYRRQGGRHYSITLEEKERNRPYLPPGGPQYFHPFIYDDIKTHGDHVHWAGNRGPHAANNRSDQAGGGHAHAGLMMYQGGTWPERYHNKMFMNNILGQRINMDSIERRGSGYVVHHRPDFINFNDRWSQVINLMYGPSGSVYMIDWYDKNQCHNPRINGHDRSNGRIYEVVYQNAPHPPSHVDLRARSSLELAELQTHKNEWYAAHARRLLQERGADPAVDRRLKAIFHDSKAVPIRLRALWALHATGGLSEAFGLRLLEDPSEFVRAWAIQFLCEDKSPGAAVPEKLSQMAKSDPSPFVRLYLASAAQRLSLASRTPLLRHLIAHAEDGGDHNLPLMYWFALEPLVGKDPALGVALLKEAQIPLIRQFIARRLAEHPKTVALR